MIEQQYAYDIAFSFAQKDEVLAYSIYQLLNKRLKCFIYSEEQKKLAGTDGEMTFNQVFSKDSRIVVIFHCHDWGNTKWTRIEETAIKNKGFDEGYDFVVLIPTDIPVNPPKWLPKTRLWVGLERWGIESAASVIEARVQELGGQIKELTVVENLAQADEKLKQKRRVEKLLSSSEGANIGNQEFLKLKSEFENIANDVKSKLGDWHLIVENNRYQGINLLSYDHSLTLQWDGDYAIIKISDGYYDKNLQKTDNFYNYKQIMSSTKIFDINEFDQYGWTDKFTKKNFFTTKKVADTYLNQFFEIVNNHRDRQKR